jgi:hypothetical protein
MSASSIYCCITRLELGGAGRCTWTVFSICVCIDGLNVAFPKCNRVINRTPWYVRTPGVMIWRVCLICHGRAPSHGVHACGYGVHVTNSWKCIVLVRACLLCHAKAPCHKLPTPLLGYCVHALCVHATNLCKCLVIFMHVLYMPLAPYIHGVTRVCMYMRYMHGGHHAMVSLPACMRQGHHVMVCMPCVWCACY